jgi:hypothetical protein
VASGGGEARRCQEDCHLGCTRVRGLTPRPSRSFPPARDLERSRSRRDCAGNTHPARRAPFFPWAIAEDCLNLAIRREGCTLRVQRARVGSRNICTEYRNVTWRRFSLFSFFRYNVIAHKCTNTLRRRRDIFLSAPIAARPAKLRAQLKGTGKHYRER